MLTLFRMLKIAIRVILKIRNSPVTAVRTMKIRKLKLFYCQKNARYRAKELCRDIFLGNVSLNEGKISVGLPVLNFRIWWRHVKTKCQMGNRSFYAEFQFHAVFKLSLAGTFQEGLHITEQKLSLQPTKLDGLFLFIRVTGHNYRSLWQLQVLYKQAKLGLIALNTKLKSQFRP